MKKKPASPNQQSARPRPFHRPGLAYFWVLNDRCEWAEVDRQLQAFAAAKDITALCLHPGPGIPYGGGEWFEFIARICRRAAELDVRIWLYDEDPCPSGNAAGRITAEHPGLAATGLHRYVFDPAAQGDNRVFCFPTGPLIWCGLVNEETGAFVDLTDQVGLVRRKWQILERWDSRYFYPDTPLYAQPLAGTTHPEFALTVPPIPPGMRLVAVVAGEPEQNSWSAFGPLVDTLNPEATRRFLESTHERYDRAVGDLFGTTIEAMFTDEPKFHDPHPWTPGLFEDFAKDIGYDIRPHLHYLFSDDQRDRACLTRLHYRDYVAKRFRSAWMQPVAAWCRAHRLKYIGHISPEDDLVEQSYVLGNLMPLLEDFDLCGTDIIIPALGDSRHPILSVGTIAAVSVAQQRGKDGTLSETGHMMSQLTTEQIGRVFLWQCLLGLTAPLANCAGLSTRGPRSLGEPVFSPDSPRWPAMGEIRRRLVEVQQVTHGARQIAPVAILWPIRSYNARKAACPETDPSLRRDFIALLAACLDRQVGTQIIDEAALWELGVKDGAAVLGQARYTHLLVPSCTVLHARTIDALNRLRRRGITVLLAGRVPDWQEEPLALKPARLDGWPRLDPAAAVATLPRLLNLDGPARDLRCTAWDSPSAPGRVTRLLMNLRKARFTARWDGNQRVLEPGRVCVINTR